MYARNPLQARIAWRAPDVGNTSITFYEVLFNGLLAQRVTGSPVSLFNRRPGALYNVTVIAATLVGPGVVSAVATLKMPEDPAPAPGGRTAEPSAARKFLLALFHISRRLSDVLRLGLGFMSSTWVFSISTSPKYPVTAPHAKFIHVSSSPAIAVPPPTPIVVLPLFSGRLHIPQPSVVLTTLVDLQGSLMSPAASSSPVWIHPWTRREASRLYAPFAPARRRRRFPTRHGATATCWPPPSRHPARYW